MSSMKAMANRSTTFLLNLILGPLSFLWESIYRIRRFCYNYGIFKQNKFMVPIVSVGNISFGGTGKTPFTLWLANYLDTLDMKVMVLMRGYKGRLEESHGLLRGGRKLGVNPIDFGDEALLLSRRLDHVSVVVGKNRSENLNFYFHSETPDVVILDDGHQHMKLRRNLNIVLFDCLMPLEKYKVAPRGYLREGLTALKDADLIVLGRADQVSQTVKEELRQMIKKQTTSETQFAEIRYIPTGLYSSNYKWQKDLTEMKGLRAICVAGVASPLSFFNLMESLGVDIVAKESFPDHYSFKPEDMTRLLSEAERLDAVVVTTEKDIVKMRRVADSDKLYYLEIKVDFISGEKVTKELLSKTFLSR